MIGKIKSTITKYAMIKPGDHVLLALSGGPDSMALLGLLLELAGQLDFALSAAHFHHGIRGATADMDAQFCETYCAECRVPFYMGRGDVPAAAKEAGRTIEQQARVMRYAFLARTARACGASRIATGHHMDDQAETVLFNIGRGAGIKGAGGMRPVRGQYIRPLLFTKRAAILAYVDEHGIPSCSDETNDDTRYTRNALRKVLRELERIIPGFVQNTSRFAALCAEDEQALAVIGAQEYARLHTGGGLDTAGLAALPRAVASRLVRALAAEAGLIYDLEKAHVDAMLALSATGKTLSLPHDYTARVSYGKLLIEPRPDAAPDYALPLNLPGVTETPAGRFIAEIIPQPGSLMQPDALTVYAPRELADVTVRPRRAGDRITAFGGQGKKLKKVYIDSKIDATDRALPVLAQDEVLWAPGVAVSERLRVSGGGEVYRISFVRR